MDIKIKNITWNHFNISKEEREKRNGHKSAVIWLTGLPCSGKTTIAMELQNLLFKKGCNVFILDGDNVRHGLNRDLGFSPSDRKENIRRVAEVAKLFIEAGFLVITAFISPYKKDRKNARALFDKDDFIEVFIKADISVCEARDARGLYKMARRSEIKEFTGISAPYESPEKPELVIDTEKNTKEESAWHIFEYLKKRGYIRP